MSWKLDMKLKAMNGTLSVPEWLRDKPEVLIERTDAGEMHRWTIASFNRRTGMSVMKKDFCHNYHTNELI